MAKESGLGMSIVVDDSSGSGQTISNDITNCQFAMPSAEQDVTGLDKSAHERIHLLADFSITLNGVFNDASNRAFQVLKNPRTLAASQLGRTTVITHSAQILSNEVLYNDFSHQRGADGSLNWSAPGSLADGTVPVWTT